MNYKRQIIEETSKIASIKDNLSSSLYQSSVFEKDKNFFYLFKKSERIVAGIYLLTSLMSDKEPLKWSIRNNSINLISNSVSLISNFSDSVPSVKSKIKDWEISVIKLASLLETANLSDLISDNNFSIISEEIYKLVKFTNNLFFSEEDYLSSNNLSEDFFKQILPEEYYKGQKDIKDKEDKRSSGQEAGFYKGHTSINDQINRDKGHLSLNNPHLLKKDKWPEDKQNIRNKRLKNERQIKIIDLIKDKESVSIKDISEKIKDCSGKTLQRELSSMVRFGVLKKHGEKRWSRYSLNL